MPFRPKCGVYSPTSHVLKHREVITETFDDDGSVSSRTYVKETPVSELTSRLPKPSDYTIPNLLKAGATLQEVPTVIIENDPAFVQPIAEQSFENVINQLKTEE